MLARVGLVMVIGMSTASATPDKDSFVVAGHAVTATLVADSTKVIVGEPVTLQLRVANATADDMYIVSAPYRGSGADAFAVKVTGPGGAVPAIPDPPMAGNGMTGAASLDAKSSFVARLLLPEWAKLDKPGRYTITLDKLLKLGVGRGDNWATKAIPHPVHLAVTIDVAAATPALLGTAIDRLGTKMLAANDDDGGSLAEALATIEDPRVVPYFVKAVALADWGRQFPAIRALGGYNTAASLAALERALALPGGGRIAAAQSIAQHKTAAGMKVLWALHTDKDDSMRLEVVHALGSFNPPDVVDRLTEMSRDKSAMVSGEAKRYLAERKKP